MSNNLSNKATYGLLYTWAAAMNGLASSSSNPSAVQGICPAGWHVPSDNEWKQLEMFIGMSQSQADSNYYRGTTEGGKLKEEGTTHWNNPNTGANNIYGFIALPCGYRSYTSTFTTPGIIGDWWTTTENNSAYVWYRKLENDESKIYRYIQYKSYGLSVRCLRDN